MFNHELSKSTAKLLAIIACALMAMTLVGKANAQSTSAQHGTVVTVQAAPATQTQQSYNYNAYQNTYQEPSRVRSVLGGVLGGVVGAIATRHSYSSTRYTAAAGAAAIGTAIGYAADRRADARQEEARAYAARASNYGAQVIVRLDDGNTVAVFSHNVSGVYPGAKVWLVGNSELIAAN